MYRTHWGFWLALAGAVVMYLTSAEKQPTGWTYAEWLQAVSFAIAWLIGKLQSSPLPGRGGS